MHTTGGTKLTCYGSLENFTRLKDVVIMSFKSTGIYEENRIALNFMDSCPKSLVPKRKLFDNSTKKGKLVK